jgi:carbon storage regulator CsrA
MLVLSRKTEESVVVGGHKRFEPMLKVTVLGINAGSVSLGFEADEAVPVHRWEVWQRILARPPPDCATGVPETPEGELMRWSDDGGGMSE